MIAALHLIGFHAACAWHAIAHPLPAPYSGFDRAGGPYNGHPARKGEALGAAAAKPVAGRKGGNGAFHSSAGAA